MLAQWINDDAGGRGGVSFEVPVLRGDVAFESVARQAEMRVDVEIER